MNKETISTPGSRLNKESGTGLLVSASRMRTTISPKPFSSPEPLGLICNRPRALSIQQKFRFEIPEIFRVQWNGTVRFHRPDPSHRALGYCFCKQDTKERYWGQQLCQMERNISVRPTEMTRPVKEDHLQSWSRIFRSDQTEMVRSI